MRAAAGYSTVAAVVGRRVRARVCLPRAVRLHFTKVSIILEFCCGLFFTAFFLVSLQCFKCVYSVVAQACEENLHSVGTFGIMLLLVNTSSPSANQTSECWFVKNDFFCEYRGSKVRLCGNHSKAAGTQTNKRKENPVTQESKKKKNPILFISYRLEGCWSRCRRTPKGVATAWSDTGGPKQSLATISGGSFEGQSGRWGWWVLRGYLSWDPPEIAPSRWDWVSSLLPLVPSSPLGCRKVLLQVELEHFFFPFFRVTRTLPLLWLITTPLKFPCLMAICRYFGWKAGETWHPQVELDDLYRDSSWCLTEIVEICLRLW